MKWKNIGKFLLKNWKLVVIGILLITCIISVKSCRKSKLEKLIIRNGTTEKMDRASKSRVAKLLERLYGKTK